MYQVMIVDDEQLTRNFLRNIIPILHDGWKVVAEASDGKEACALLAKQEVDLVITDIKMPIMDGVALCEYIYQNHPGTHTIILSGYGEFDYAKQAISCNVSNYLLKPIVNDELQKVLSNITTTLDRKTFENIEYANLLHLSSKYKEEITTKLLQAIVDQSHVQTKALLPLIYELEINLIEEEGVIVMLQLSDVALSQKSVHHNRDLTKLLIYQTAKVALKDTPNNVFLDSDSNTLIYMPIINQIDIKDAVQKVYSPINQLFIQETSFTLVCYVGTKESEILQLATSFMHAKQATIQSMLALTPYDDNIIIYTDNTSSHISEKLQTYILSFGYALQNNDAINIKLMKDNLLSFAKQHVQPPAQNIFSYYVLSQLCKLLFLDDAYFHDIFDFSQCLDALEQSQHHQNVAPLGESMIISTTKKYILDHYHEPISLSMIADNLSISPSYLSNLFHESVGQSYIKYLTEVRLKQASLLLKGDRGLTLEQITKKVGYISVKHFSYVFKKNFNITPGEYRKLKNRTSINE